MRINLKKLAYVFLSVSVLPIIIGLLLFFNTNNFIKQAASTDALIIKLKPASMYEGRQLYAPVIQFKDSKGNTITQTAHISTGKGTFKVGSKIGIYYTKDNPKNFILNIFSAKWFGVIACSIATFWLLILSACCLLIQEIIKRIKMRPTKCSDTASI